MDRNQTIMLVLAIALLAYVWYIMNPTKKEKCCGVAVN